MASKGLQRRRLARLVRNTYPQNFPSINPTGTNIPFLPFLQRDPPKIFKPRCPPVSLTGKPPPTTPRNLSRVLETVLQSKHNESLKSNSREGQRTRRLFSTRQKGKLLMNREIYKSCMHPWCFRITRILSKKLETTIFPHPRLPTEKRYIMFLFLKTTGKVRNDL